MRSAGRLRRLPARARPVPMLSPNRWRETQSGEDPLGVMVRDRWVRIRALDGEPFGGVVGVDDAVPADGAAVVVGAELEDVAAGEPRRDGPAAVTAVGVPEHASPSAWLFVGRPERAEPQMRPDSQWRVDEHTGRRAEAVAAEARPVVGRHPRGGWTIVHRP